MKSSNVKAREKEIHFPMEDERIMKVRKTNREEEEKEEKCKKEEIKENQEEEVIDRNSSGNNPFIQ